MERPDWETNWQPLSLDAVRSLFQDFSGKWWIAGGWAIDLVAGEPYREHADVDVLIPRSQVGAMHDVMKGWEIYACQYPGHEGIRLWNRGEALPAVVHDIWCRPGFGLPWALQLMVLEDDGDRWTYRRDSRIGGNIDELTVQRQGMPVLVPELQLLYKSKQPPRPKDVRDFERMLPLLDVEQKVWLREALIISSPDNPWLKVLGDG
jgi:hypothetical protein